ILQGDPLIEPADGGKNHNANPPAPAGDDAVIRGAYEAADGPPGDKRLPAKMPMGDGPVAGPAPVLEGPTVIVTPAVEAPAPNSGPLPVELCKASLPPYIIEPPDILLIDTVRMIPLPPYRIEPLDILLVQVTPTLPNQPISGAFTVTPDGTINLG